MYDNLMCVNLKQFNALTKYTLDIDASILYAAIKYQTTKTKIKKEGIAAIARTREQLASYANASKKVTDRLLRELTEMGLISTKCGLWRNKKRLYLSATKDIQASVHVQKMNVLTSMTKDNRASLLVAYIANAIKDGQNTINRNGKLYTISSLDELKTAMHATDTRKVNEILNALTDKNIINLECRYKHGKRYYLSIDDTFYRQFCTNYEQQQAEAKDVQNVSAFAKRAISYNNSSLRDINIINNNTNNLDTIEIPNKAKTEGVVSDVIVTLDTHEHTMTKRDWSYIYAALDKTILQAEHAVSRQELKSQIKYALATSAHTKRMTSFKHCVNSFMYLIRAGLWKQPLGYHKYSDERKETYQNIQSAEAAHYALKGQGELQRLADCGELPEYVKIEPPKAEIGPKRHYLGDIEYMDSGSVQSVKTGGNIALGLMSMFGARCEQKESIRQESVQQASQKAGDYCEPKRVKGESESNYQAQEYKDFTGRANERVESGELDGRLKKDYERFSELSPEQIMAELRKSLGGR
jgi:hypothetical protein